MEDENQMNEGGAKQWLQDNLRIIISILIVLVIALGIYSYSKRTTVSTDDQVQISEETTAQEEESAKSDEQKPADPKKAQEVVAPSQETEQAFIETAVAGDGSTRLARRALANYLEKNPDSALTPEHKIYIEDYLRKKVGQKKITIGTSLEFSKSLIQEAISQSKNLNEAQLKNLHKYAVRVPSLT